MTPKDFKKFYYQCNTELAIAGQPFNNTLEFCYTKFLTTDENEIDIENLFECY